MQRFMMDKKIIKANKEAFDYWLDGGEIVLATKQEDSNWFYEDLGVNVEWNCNWENPVYLQNDAYIEFRKALLEGKTIQTKILSSEYPMATQKAEERNKWFYFDEKTNKFMSSKKYYRIKPEGDTC